VTVEHSHLYVDLKIDVVDQEGEPIVEDEVKDEAWHRTR
jgi:hypothetical protein